jgi:16S rRNA (cytosine1402-N4)-methyltransferase
MLIGIDQDEEALKHAAKRIGDAHPDHRFKSLHGSFSNLDGLLLGAGLPGIDGFLFDLGVSSHQLDTPSRGFSYMQDAPLDFRMDPSTQTQTAAEIINTSNKADLAWILRTFGEEKWAARIAEFIVARRAQEPFATTLQLVECVQAAVPVAARGNRGHPAKRTFQALRIYVNSELEALASGLEAAARWLNPKGRIAVISYHSLEDRIVKEFLVRMRQGCICDPGSPVCICGKTPVFCEISKKPLTPCTREIDENPRSKSAKLRWGLKN